MAKRKSSGIVLDVGYALDFDGLSEEIVRKLNSIKDKSVNFGLDTEAEKEIDNIKKELKGLKNEIRTTLSPGERTGDQVLDLMDHIEKAVNNLNSSFDNLSKRVETLEMGTVANDVKEAQQNMETYCGTINNTAKALHKAAESSKNNRISVVDSNQMKSLERQSKVLDSILNKMASFDSSSMSFSKREKDIDKLTAHYESLEDEIYDLEKAVTDYLDAGKMSKGQTFSNVEDSLKRLVSLYSDYAGVLNDIERLYNDSNFANKNPLMFEKIDIGIINDNQESLEKSYSLLIDKITKRNVDVQKELRKVGLVEPGDYRASQKPIVVPIKVATDDSSTLIEQAVSIVEKVNKEMVNHPIEIDFALMPESSFKGRRKRELMQAITKQLEDINDKDLREKLSDLISKAEKQFSDDIKVKINVEDNFFNVVKRYRKFIDIIEKLNEKTKEPLDKFVKGISETLNNAGIVLTPKIEIDDAAKEQLEKQWKDLLAKNPIHIVQNADLNAQEMTVKDLDENQGKMLNGFMKLIDKINKALDGQQEKFEEWTSALATQIKHQKDIYSAYEQYINEITEKVQLLQQETSKIKPVTLHLDENELKILTDFLGDFFELKLSPQDDQKLQNQIQNLASEMTNIMDVAPIHTWSSEFIDAINEVSEALHGIVGKNALSDMMDKWNESDWFMSTKSYNKEHIVERSAAFDKNGRIFGDYDYGSQDDVKTSIRNKNVKDILGVIHSHPNKYLASFSGINKRKDGSVGGDLFAFLSGYLADGIKYQLVNTIAQVGVFDAESFYKEYEKIFKSKDLRDEFRKVLAEKVNQLNTNDVAKRLHQNSDLTKFLENDLGADVKGFYKTILSMVVPNIDESTMKKYVDLLDNSNWINHFDQGFSGDQNELKNRLNSKLKSLVSYLQSQGVNALDMVSFGDDFKNDIISMLGLNPKDSKNDYDRIFAGVTKYAAQMQEAVYQASKEISEKYPKKKLPTIDNLFDFYTKYNHDDFKRINPLNLPVEQLDILSKIGESEGISNLSESVNKLYDAIGKFSDTKIFDIGINSEDVEKMSSAIAEFAQAMKELRANGGIKAEFDSESIQKASNSLDSIFKKLSNILTSLNQFSKLFQRAFDVSTTAELSNEFKNIQANVNGFNKDTKNWNFSLNKTKDAFKEIVSQYEIYKKHGGTKEFGELFKDSKISDKAVKQYDKLKASAEQSAKAVEKETDEVKDVKPSFELAAEAKEKFTKANQKVDTNAEESAKSIDKEKEKIKEISDAIGGYLKARNSYEHLFDPIFQDLGDEVNVLEWTEKLDDEWKNKLKNGEISQEELEGIFEEKYSKIYYESIDRLQNLLPNIDIDELDTIVSKVVNLFENIDKASEILYNHLKNNLDFSDIIKIDDEQQLEYFLSELDLLSKPYKDSTWKTNLISDPSQDVVDLYRTMKHLETDNFYDLSDESRLEYLNKIKEVLPYIENAYEEIHGKPYKFSEEQNVILEKLEDEKLTLTQILSLWDRLGIQAEKGVLLTGNNKIASKTIIGDLNNVFFEELNNVQDGIYKSFNTILHSHADGLGTFSPEDINMVIENWEQGVRKLRLFVDNELHTIDFKNATKEQAVDFFNDFSHNFEEAITKATADGLKPLENNELFSQIKSDALKSARNKNWWIDYSINSRDYTKNKLSKNKILDDLNTSDSISGLQKESSEMEDLAESSDKAAQSKKEFTEANSKVQDSINESVPKIQIESNSFEELLQALLGLDSANSEKLSAFKDSINELVTNVAQSSDLIDFLKELKSLMSSFGNDKATEKIDKLADNFWLLGEAVKQLDFSNLKDLQGLTDILGNFISNMSQLQTVINKAQSTTNGNTNILQQTAKDFLTDNYKQVEDEVEKKLVEQGFTSFEKVIDTTTKGLIRVKAMVRDIQGEWREVTMTSMDGVGFGIDKISKNDVKTNKFEQMYQTLQKIRKQAEDNNQEQENLLPIIKADDEAWEKMLEYVKEYKEELGDIMEVYRHTENNMRTGEMFESFRIVGSTGAHVTVGASGPVDSGQHYPGGGVITKQADKYSDILNGLTTNKTGYKYLQEYLDLVERIKNAIAEYRRIGEEKFQLIDPKEIEHAETLKTSISELLKILKNATGNENFISGESKAQDLLGKISRTMNTKSSMPKELMNEYKILADTLNKVSFNTPLSEVKELENRVTELNRKLAESGTIGRSMFDKIKISLKSQISQQIAMWFSVYDFIRYGRRFIETVHEMDDALTEMRKVSDESVASLKNYQKETYDTASAIGTTALQLQKSTADWLRLGESFEEAKESAKDANILYNVSEFESIDAATESLVSMSQAYKDLDKMEIIDVMNNVGNNFSISTDQLSMALQNAAAVLQTQGNDLYKATALITAGNAITQDYSKVSGRLDCLDIWKHISFNIFNCKVRLKLYATI